MDPDPNKTTNDGTAVAHRIDNIRQLGTIENTTINLTICKMSLIQNANNLRNNLLTFL